MRDHRRVRRGREAPQQDKPTNCFPLLPEEVRWSATPWFSVITHSEAIGADPDGVAAVLVDLHVHTCKGPVPRRHQDRLWLLGVAQNHRRVIVHLGVDFGFVGLGHGGDGERSPPVHDVNSEIICESGHVVGN